MGQVLIHQQLQARIESWVAGRTFNVAEEVPSCDAHDMRLRQGLADSGCHVEAPAGSPCAPAGGTATKTDASAISLSAQSKQVQT